jgi:hypothetical protein
VIDVQIGIGRSLDKISAVVTNEAKIMKEPEADKYNFYVRGSF